MNFFSGKSFTFIPTTQGNYLLMLNGYTYKKNNKKALLYYCSKRMSGCKASVKLDKNLQISHAFEEHGHDPPNYVVTSSGEYIKM